MQYRSQRFANCTNILSAINSLPATKQMTWVRHAYRKSRFILTLSLNLLIDHSRRIRQDDGLYVSERKPRNEYEEKMQFTTGSSPQFLFCEKDPISRRSSSLSEGGSRTSGNLDKSAVISIIRSKTIFKARPLNRRSLFNDRVLPLYSSRLNYVILILRINNIAIKLRKK